MCKTRWSEILTSFERNHDDLIAGHPDYIEEIELLQTALITLGQLIHIPPPVNGNGAASKELIARAVAERTMLCKHLDGKGLFTAMLRLYAAIHREMRDSVLPEQEESTEEIRKQRSRKRNLSEEEAKNRSQLSCRHLDRGILGYDPRASCRQGTSLPPLRASEMEAEHTLVDETTDKPNRDGSSRRPASQVGRLSLC
jgi:hypothetical protein